MSNRIPEKVLTLQEYVKKLLNVSDQFDHHQSDDQIDDDDQVDDDDQIDRKRLATF